jgi:rSAM/selenodomain-associated transferase 1
MAKEPIVGKTKTRLSPPLSGQEATELYHCFLLDTLELMGEMGSVQPIIAYLPEEAESFFRGIAMPGFELVPQVGDELGERLDNALSQCLRSGYRQAVVMDSDSPTLPATYLRQAFQELDDAAVDVVLGPCDDGGYYLIGLKSPCPVLFRGIVMSTSTVMAETVERARQEGLRVACLPGWYDVDTSADLERLIVELRSHPHPSARHTRAFLSDPEGRRIPKYSTGQGDGVHGIARDRR